MTMNTDQQVQVRVTHRFQASAERVFDAWLDPEKAGRWLFVTPTGQMVRVEIDARVGGSYAIVERRDGEDVEHVGTYLEIDRPRRLVFTLAAEKYSQDISRVVVEIVPLETGCELTLTHEMSSQWAEYKDRTEQGWNTLFDGLDALLGATPDAATAP